MLDFEGSFTPAIITAFSSAKTPRQCSASPATKLIEINLPKEATQVWYLVQGILTDGAKFRTVYLLLNLACFVKKLNNIFNIKKRLYKLVSRIG